MKKILIVDASSLINLMYYRAEDKKTIDGEPANAVYGALRVVCITMGAIGFDGLVFVFDDMNYAPSTNGQTGIDLKRSLCSTYRRARLSVPAKSLEQIQLLKRTINKIGIPSIEIPNYEGHDTIGSVAAQCEAAGYETVVITNDKDILQLLSARTSVIIQKPAYLFGNLFDLNSFDKGIRFIAPTPESIPDVKAITGSPPHGVNVDVKIGPLGAYTLIYIFGSIENLYNMYNDFDKLFETYSDFLMQFNKVDSIENLRKITHTHIKRLTKKDETIKSVLAAKKIFTIMKDAPLQATVSDYIVPDIVEAMEQMRDAFDGTSKRAYAHYKNYRNEVDDEARRLLTDTAYRAFDIARMTRTKQEAVIREQRRIFADDDIRAINIRRKRNALGNAYEEYKKGTDIEQLVKKYGITKIDAEKYIALQQALELYKSGESLSVESLARKTGVSEATLNREIGKYPKLDAGEALNLYITMKEGAKRFKKVTGYSLRQFRKLVVQKGAYNLAIDDATKASVLNVIKMYIAGKQTAAITEATGYRKSFVTDVITGPPLNSKELAIELFSYALPRTIKFKQITGYTYDEIKKIVIEGFGSNEESLKEIDSLLLNTAFKPEEISLKTRTRLSSVLGEQGRLFPGMAQQQITVARRSAAMRNAYGKVLAGDANKKAAAEFGISLPDLNSHIAVQKALKLYNGNPDLSIAELCELTGAKENILKTKLREIRSLDFGSALAVYKNIDRAQRFKHETGISIERLRKYIHEHGIEKIVQDEETKSDIMRVLQMYMSGSSTIEIAQVTGLRKSFVTDVITSPYEPSEDRARALLKYALPGSRKFKRITGFSYRHIEKQFFPKAGDSE